MSVVRLPRLEDEYKVKEGSELVLPCVRGEAGVSAEWRRGGESVRGGGDIILDRETGGLMILSMSEDMEGEYSCRVVISDTGEERVIRTQVRSFIVMITIREKVSISYALAVCMNKERITHSYCEI